jgi:hypothetical protein
MNGERSVECDPALCLDGPWRAVIGVWRIAGGVDRHMRPWLIELELANRSSCLWTSHAASGRAYRGAAFGDRAAAMLCAGAELGLLDARAFASLCEWRAETGEALSWARIGKGDEWAAGKLPLREVLRRLGASIVRLEVIEESAEAREEG